AISLAFATRGAHVWACDIIEDEVRETARVCASAGGRCTARVVDVTDKAAIEAFVAEACAEFSRVDILVNNAGGVLGQVGRPLEAVPQNEWQAIIDVNLTGAFLCCKHIGAAMAERNAGSVINISSVAGHVGMVRSVSYCASKGGLELLTKALALEWAPRGVRVNCLAPGYVDTDLTSGLLHHATLGKPFLDHTPMGRFGETRDVAGAAVFLASDASAYMTGQSMVVDGGWTAH
ncbi:MAG TPA: SDR family oxidoreductase, partial [Acetobacteraceae bacterium]|nr:SDR family oxidoreductase [Acetobacteraceae bacterium]